MPSTSHAPGRGALARPDAAADIDQRVFLHDLSWKEYELMLAIRGDGAGPRMTYLAGELEIMSPSRSREGIAALLGRLLEVYADERGIVLEAYKSMTIKSAPTTRGVEPDECYAVGAAKPSPDLAIEVVWTSGGIDKLAVYAGLGVSEVWVWERDRLGVFVLREGAYHESATSGLLPDLDVALLASHLAFETQTEAVRAYRATLRRA